MTVTISPLYWRVNFSEERDTIYICNHIFFEPDLVHRNVLCSLYDVIYLVSQFLPSFWHLKHETSHFKNTIFFFSFKSLPIMCMLFYLGLIFPLQSRSILSNFLQLPILSVYSLQTSSVIHVAVCIWVCELWCAW